MLIINTDKTGAFIEIDAFGPFYFYGLHYKNEAGGVLLRRDGAVKHQMYKLNHIKRRTCT